MLPSLQCRTNSKFRNLLDKSIKIERQSIKIERQSIKIEKKALNYLNVATLLLVDENFMMKMKVNDSNQLILGRLKDSMLDVFVNDIDATTFVRTETETVGMCLKKERIFSNLYFKLFYYYLLIFK